MTNANALLVSGLRWENGAAMEMIVERASES
jgi:hypothetical protein